MSKITIIGVAGGSGSGKSTLVKKLRDSFSSEHVATLCHDFYYRSNSGMPLEDRAKLNYDHPNSFETDMMIEHIKELKKGNAIYHPQYSFNYHTRESETVLLKPAPVIIIDGIMIFENRELRDLMDIKVYVDTDSDLRLARRILRDTKERGRSLDSVINQYTQTVKPMHDEFVEPSKRYADIIIPEGGFNSVAVSLLIENLRHLILE